MGNCRFLYNNQWKSGTLTANTENSAFPKENTRHRWFTKTYRSTDASAEWLKINRGTNVLTPAIQAVAIRFNNFLSGATARFEWETSDTFPPAVGQRYTCSINNKLIVGFLDGAKGYQWWRLYLNDTTSYIELGYVFMGPYFEPSRNRNIPEEETPIDPSLMNRSEGGQLSSVIRDQLLQKAISFEHLTATDKANFDDMFATVGIHDNIIYVDDSALPMTTSLFCRIAEFKWDRDKGSRLWNLRLGLEEQL